jgi:hypothetical protein
VIRNPSGAPRLNRKNPAKLPLGWRTGVSDIAPVRTYCSREFTFGFVSVDSTSTFEGFTT